MAAVEMAAIVYAAFFRERRASRHCLGQYKVMHRRHLENIIEVLFIGRGVSMKIISII